MVIDLHADEGNFRPIGFPYFGDGSDYGWRHLKMINNPVS